MASKIATYPLSPDDDPAPTAPSSQAASLIPIGAFLRPPDVNSGRPRRRIRQAHFAARAQRDPQLLLAIALTIPVGVIELLAGRSPNATVLAVAAAYLATQIVLTATGRGEALAAARLGLSLAFILYANAQQPLAIGPLSALQVPVVALAAALGGRATLAVALAGFIASLAPAVLPGTPDSLRQESLAIATAEIVIVIGSRRVVAAMEHNVERARQARARDRRRARQVSAVEEVGRLLAREGPTTAVLDRVMDILEKTFDFHYPSVYLWDGATLRLGAYRNYANPIFEFPPTFGVIGRVTRTREAIFLPDVTADPDYASADPEVNSEISIPLVSGDELFGVLNVESNRARRLDSEDFATMQLVGDRLAQALALGHERQKLTARGEMLVRLTGFAAGLNATLDPDTTHEMVVVGASRVVEADAIVLTVLDDRTGEFHVVAVDQGDKLMVGVRILPGEGITGRAIAERHLVVEPRLERASFPQAAARARIPDVVTGMAVPLLRNDVVIGVLLWLRGDLTRTFDSQEQEVATLLGVQVTLALVNGGLLQEARTAAITDPLTRLHNRRHFDASFDRITASRARQVVDERQPLSAIMFDLDHFGLVNKQHGHQAGDRVLIAFAEVLRARVRASDLVARYGGEEFVIVLDGATLVQATRVAEDVRRGLETVEVALIPGGSLVTSVSAGCAALAPDEADGSALLARADVALAMAKNGGRNQVVAA